MHRQLGIAQVLEDATGSWTATSGLDEEGYCKDGCSAFRDFRGQEATKSRLQSG